MGRVAFGGADGGVVLDDGLLLSDVTAVFCEEGGLFTGVLLLIYVPYYYCILSKLILSHSHGRGYKRFHRVMAEI